jgi:hypothetical protein
MPRPLYEHRQPGWPLRLTFFGLALGFLVMAGLPAWHGLAMPPRALVLGAGLAALIGWAFGALTVRIDARQVEVLFGPGWPRKTVPLDEIAGVEVTRTSFIDGWGVHRTRRGWLYNISGFDAVQIRLANGRAVLVGTDEPRRLKTALERAMTRRPARP